MELNIINNLIKKLFTTLKTLTFIFVIIKIYIPKILILIKS